MRTNWYTRLTLCAAFAGILALVSSGCTNPSGDPGTNYTVTFVVDGGAPAPTAQTVAEGGKATKPGDPAKAGFLLAGWYKEMGLTNRWNFVTDTVTEDMTLYAKWIMDPFTTLAKYRETVLVTPDALNSVTITGNSVYGSGAFPAGRTVTLSAFKIAKYETTYELWYEVKQWAGSNGYSFANAGREGHNGTDGATLTGAKTEPVTTINWRDAVIWCNAYSELSGKEPVYYTNDSYTTVLKTSTNDGGTDTAADKAVMKPGANGYRLPTEAQWEYAARGGGTPSTISSFANKWAGTNTDADLGTYAWYYPGAGGATHTVGDKTANAAGLYDMSGNVWEWCWDWYDSVGTETPPTGAVSGSIRVIRGGSWYNIASACAVSIRSDAYPDYRYDDLGFRVACP